MSKNGIIRFLGGASEVGRLAMLYEVEDKKLLCDYGFAPAKPPKYPEEAPKIDYTLLTHAHIDHSGMIPWVAGKRGSKIISTSLTATISDLLAMDSSKIAKMEGWPVPFDDDDIKSARRNIDEITPNEHRDLDGIEIRTHSAGHIPGAIMYEIRSHKKNLLFTGDLNTIDTHLVNGAKPVKCDILVMEATYAGREHPDREELEKQFLERVRSVVNKGGLAIIPSFAVGRTQEILITLAKDNFEVWLDGMGKTVNGIMLDQPSYLANPKLLEEADGRVKIVHSQHGRNLAAKGEVIVTTSGMLDGGPVLDYLRRIKDDTKSAVLLTGYQVQGTNGRMLLDFGLIDFAGVTEKVNCKVEFFDFSAHAGHSQLKEFIKKCEPEKVILCHSDNRQALVDDLKDRFEFLTPNTGDVVNI